MSVEAALVCAGLYLIFAAGPALAVRCARWVSRSLDATLSDWEES